MTSEPEDMSVKSLSQFAEVNEAVVKLPLSAKTYAESIKYYRFKIERFHQDIREVLSDILEHTKINEEMLGDHRRDASKHLPSDESQSFQGHTEREALKGSGAERQAEPAPARQGPARPEANEDDVPF